MCVANSLKDSEQEQRPTLPFHKEEEGACPDCYRGLGYILTTCLYLSFSSP